jgi:RES domain-containing protein
VSGQITDRVLTAYRIGDPDGEYPVFDATGSKIVPGRWNTPDAPMIYASENYSTTMLEKLVHGSGMLPPNQHFVTITVPNGLSYEAFPVHQYRKWADETPSESRAYGESWQKARRSLILIVPSVVARMERNFLVNPDHPDFRRIAVSMHEPVYWDNRLFRG